MLQGRVAVVTGAGRGIGRAVAELFVENGAAVVVNDVDPEAARETVERCTAADPAARAAASVGSVADPDYARRLAHQAVETFGALDVLVNNAGIVRDAMAHRMTPESWREVIDVNLSGTFHCAQACGIVMRDAAKREREEAGEVRFHRKIVNFFSTAAIRGNVGQANYAAAKLGNVGLTRTLAREWAPFRINVNAVAPGFTETRMTEGIPQARREELLAQLPFGRPARPLDIARVVLFLASPMSDWVTGQVINVSGGQQIP